MLAVSFEPRERLFQLNRMLQLPFPLLSDPERDVYRAFGLGRGSLLKIFSPGTILAYIRLLAQGNWYHFGRSDLRQLGGDFVLDVLGNLRFAHRSGAPHDRPSVDLLVKELEGL